MPSPQRSVVFWDVPFGTSTLIAVGDVIIPTTDATSMLVATSANRGTRRSEGIALTAFGGVGTGTVEIQQVGTVDASISGLGAGSASWVRCSSTGRPERFTPSSGGSSDIIGRCEADGRLHLAFGQWTEDLAVAANVSAECIDVTAYGALGNGVADDAPAIRLAILAAIAAGHYRVCFPETTSFYRLGSAFRTGSYVSIFVNEPIKFTGKPGARLGTGKVQIKADAGLTAFFCATGKAAEGGSGATGAVFEGLDIRSAGAVSTVAYAASTAYTVGQRIKGNDPYLLTIGHSTYTGGSEHVWEVIKAGTTAAVPEASAYDEGNSHTPDRATTWAAGQTVGAGRIMRGTSSAHWDVFFIANNSGTTGASEPAWNFTPTTTTNDNGITWTCMTDPNILTLGTVIARVVAFHGIMAWCPITVRDCYFKDWQNAGIMLEGNASTTIIDSNAIGCLIEDCEVRTPLSGSGLLGIGFYLRGGGITGARFTNCWVYGSAGTAKGLVAMPTDGTQHNHGFLDRSFLGGNSFVNCGSQECAGYELWIQGTASDSTTTGFQANSGRVRHDAASFSAALMDAKEWSILGGPNSYSSTGTTLKKNGLRNAYELSQDSLYYAGLNDGSVFHWFSYLIDSGTMGWRILNGWNHFGWASTSFSPISVANRQVAVSANLPLGQEGGSLKLQHGYGMGAVTDEQHVFPNLTEFLGTISYNERGGYRRVGDICLRPDRVASTAYGMDIVVTAGYTGPTWTATTAVLAQVVAGSSSSHIATIMAPTSGANLNRFKCTTAGTTGGVEPNWALAPSVGNTVTDGTVVWTNVGVAPVVANYGYVGTLPSGGEANTSSNVGSGAGQLAKAKSGVDLPFKTIAAGAGITVTNNTNDVTIAATGTSITGTDTHVLFFDGANNPAGESDFTWDKTNNRLKVTGAIRVGTTTNTDGIGLPNNTGLYFWNSTSSAMRNVLQLDGANNVRLGDASTAALVASYTGTAGFFNGATYDILISASTDIKTGLPIAGSSSNSVPFRFKVASVTATAGAGSTKAASSSEYECPIIIFTTSADGQILTLPNSNGAVFIVVQAGTGVNAIFKVSGGTGVTVAAGKTAIIRCNGTDYVRVTSDA